MPLQPASIVLVSVPGPRPLALHPRHAPRTAGASYGSLGNVVIDVAYDRTSVATRSQTARFAPPPFDRAGRCREHFFAGRLSTGTLCQRRGSHDGAISSRERRYGRWPALLPSEEWRPPRSDNSFTAARAGCDARGAFATFGPRWRTRDERWLQRSGGVPSAAPWTNVDPRHRMRTSVLKDGRHRRRLHDRRGRAPVVLEHRERGGGRAPQMHRR